MYAHLKSPITNYSANGRTSLYAVYLSTISSIPKTSKDPINRIRIMCEIYLNQMNHQSLMIKLFSFPESTSSCNRSSLNDVHILNLSQMKELKILNENRDPVADPPSLNVARVNFTLH